MRAETAKNPNVNIISIVNLGGFLPYSRGSAGFIHGLRNHKTRKDKQRLRQSQRQRHKDKKRQKKTRDDKTKRD